MHVFLSSMDCAQSYKKHLLHILMCPASSIGDYGEYRDDAI